MRLALADAGDSVEDANFAETLAEAGILRLYNFIEWVKEMIDEKDITFRTDKSFNFHDTVFANEMNKRSLRRIKTLVICFSEKAFERDFFEMQQSRDKYRELCGAVGVQKALVLQFIEVQSILLSPICPHVSEHIWKLLGKEGSILTIKWPKAQEVDDIIIKSFRNKKLSKEVSPSKPTHATAYVAKTYPNWQCIVLSKLKEMYTSSPGAIPDNKVVSQELGKIPELKKWMKKIMPFVQFTKDRVAATGITRIIFVQIWVWMDWKLITLTWHQITEPSVSITFSNNQPHSGLFEFVCGILEGDTTESVIARLCRTERGIKNVSKVKLFRYSDPLMGSRKMPSLDKPFDGKVEITPSDIWSVDLQGGNVFIMNRDSKESVGNKIVYNIC
ncbi:LARS [Lepeophtheirus salmonis]|uniref:LARS n=1 Tax=Lepeophtheirus salmonis TaxID=72036 RepID=A0A7R8CQZ3_LEPSM|nr:LARS [Lepeophtheirus salmonis]CAF2900087.1 LARS [Lepeophtheirus salmonis]